MSHGAKSPPAAAAGAHEADPSAITAAGFAIALSITSIQAAGFIDRLDWVGPLAMISGIVLLLACIVHLHNGSTLHGTTSGVYGAYWLSISLQIMAATATATATSAAAAAAGDAASGVAFPGLMDHLDANLTYLRVPLAIFTLYAALASYLIDRSYLLVYILFECQLVSLIAGQQADNAQLMQAGGWFGILSSSLAFYLSASFLLKPFVSLPGVGAGGLPLPAWLSSEPPPHPRSAAVELSLNPQPRFETSESGADAGDMEAQGKQGYNSGSSSSRRALRLHGHKSTAHLLSFMGRRGNPHSTPHGSHLHGSHATFPKHGSWEGTGGSQEAEACAAEPAQPESTTMTPSVSSIDFFQRWKVWS